MQLSIYLCSFSSTCFGLLRPSSEAMDVIISLHMQHMVSLVQLGVGLEECVCWWRVAVQCSARAERTQINTQLHQVGKSFRISNQNARYNSPKNLCRNLKRFLLCRFENFCVLCKGSKRCGEDRNQKGGGLLGKSFIFLYISAPHLSLLLASHQECGRSQFPVVIY